MDINKQLEIIKRGAVEIVAEEELKKKLQDCIEQKKPLKVKAGFDPTAPDIHLGHTVLLRKMRQFQDLGHEVYFLIGDFTACIGDPSGRSEKRKQLTKEEVLKNALTYKEQVSKILDAEKLKIVFNSEWFEKISVQDLLNLTTHATISQILAREDFKKRLAKKEDISILEIMYPLLQGYDSVKLEADIELGGTDQIFNLLVARDIQKAYDQPLQVVITMPLLEGTDGVLKMSKSFGNYISINESAGEVFGKIMSISDKLMMKYYELLTDEDLHLIKKMHPKEAKLKLAEEIVAQYHSKQAANSARMEFERVFSAKELPKELPIFALAKPMSIVDILTQSGMTKSKNEARRLIRQDAIIFNEARVSDENAVITESGIMKVGTRRFLKINYEA
jgi:tyrosyl-tRNA synthetase